MLTENDKHLAFGLVSIPDHKGFLLQDKFAQLEICTAFNTDHGLLKGVRYNGNQDVHHNNSH
jgi:hypothetical protein